MKKVTFWVLLTTLVLSFCGPAVAEEPPGAGLSLISCPELGFTTMADPSYPWEYVEGDGITIYTGTEGYIPFVLVWQSEDLIAEPLEYIKEQYTPHIQETYGDDLVGYVEYEIYNIGGKQLPAGLYTYKVQGHLVELLRLYDSTGERTVAYTAKYLQGDGADTLAALDDAIRYFKADDAAGSEDSTKSLTPSTGTFSEYWDFEQADGTYAYAFPRILISMDEYWYQNTRVVVGEGGATVSFYHKASYEAYDSENLGRGLLFTIGASVNTDFQNLPDFVCLGFDEEEAMNYYAALPTDYQAYTGDDAIRAEYDELWSGVKNVLASVQIKGNTETEVIEEPIAALPRIFSSGDYDYVVTDGTARIKKYTGDEETITIPSEIDGYQVTAIAPNAFEYQEMKSVSIPDSIRTLEQEAFEYCEITDALQLPQNVTISRDAFCYAVLPSVVVIPEGATVEERAFGYCEEMERVCIDPNVVLKGRAFAYCDDLTLAVFADGSQLEEKAFEYCSNLAAAIFCGNVQTEEKSFSYCRNIEITQGGDYETLKQSALDGSLEMQEGTYAAVRTDAPSAETETGLPPAHVPEEGEYLCQALGNEKLANIKEEPPVELSFHVDQGGYGRTATFKEGDTLDRAVELLCAIQIGEESDEWVTDNYNWIQLTWEDGSETFISLNLYRLEYSAPSAFHTYELEHLDEFWSYCYSYLTDDPYEEQYDHSYEDQYDHSYEEQYHHSYEDQHDHSYEDQHDHSYEDQYHHSYEDQHDHSYEYQHDHPYEDQHDYQEHHGEHSSGF